MQKRQGATIALVSILGTVIILNWCDLARIAAIARCFDGRRSALRQDEDDGAVDQCQPSPSFGLRSR